MPKQKPRAAVVARGGSRWTFVAALAVAALLGACTAAPKPVAQSPAARAQAPAWMDANLPPVFRLLRGLGAAVAL